MNPNSYMPARLVKVRGTEFLASDSRDRYREKIARITLDSMAQFVGLLDATGTVLEINQVALTAAGIKLSDVEGKPFWTTFWWQVSEEINTTLKESIARASRGEFVRWDTPIYRHAGGTETIIIDASLMPVRDERGNVVFITAEGRDITEKKAYELEIARQCEELANLGAESGAGNHLAKPLSSGELLASVEPHLQLERQRRQWEEELRSSERKFSAAFEQSPLALTITSLDDGHLVEVNEGFVRLSGYTRDESLGRTPEELNLWVEPERHGGGLAQLRAGKSIFGVETRFRTKSGQERIGVISASLIEINSRPHVVSSVADITERKQAEEAVRESERSLSTLISNLPGFAFRCLNDEAWTMVFISERVREMTGYAAADFLARRVTWDSLVHPDDVDRVRADAGDHIERKIPIRITYRIIAADGQVRWVWDRATPVFSETGEIAFWEGFVTDITERKEAEEALRETEHRFTMFMQNLPGLAWIKDLEGRYVYANAAAEAAFRTPRAELYGKSDEEVFPPETAAQFRENDRRVLSGGVGIQTIETLEQEDGAHHSIVSKFPIWGRNGQPAMIGGVAFDITERRQAEQALRESEADARFLAEVGERIRLATNAEDLLYALSRAAGDYLDVRRCFFVEIDVANDRGLIRRDYCRGVDTVAGEYRVSEYSSIARAEISGGRTIVNIDSRKDPRTTALYETVYEPRGERAYVAVPLMREGHWSGTFWVSTEEPRHWQQREVTLLETVAERGWNAVEQLRLDAELRKSEERFRTLANNMSQLVWTCDELGSATWYNQRWYEYTGTSWEQMRGDGWKSVQHPDHLERVMVSLQRSITSGQAWEDTFPLRGKDGTYRWFLSRAIPIRNAAGRIASWFGTNTDVTEQRAAEEALREADRRKDEFLAMLAHELRNPLAPIRNAAQVLKLVGPADASQQWAREVIERQTQHLTRLVDDLLEVSRITQGKVTLTHEPLEMATIINRAVEASRPLIDARHHQLTVALPAEPVRVEGDLTRLVQVVGNLLNNAAKFTDEGGHIRLEVTQEDREAVIRVRDDGIGMPPDLLRNVFDLFTQADRSLDRSQGGLGIGLTIVRRLAEMHGGSVEAKSGGPNQGSEFIVRLPASAPTTVANAATPVNLHPAPDKLRVLVVEDNVDSAEMMAFVLKLSGHEVQLAGDGPEALTAARAFLPQVVLCDIGLPKMNGYEVAAQLRAQEEFKQTRLIALSGYGQEDDRRRAREAGFDYHLTKPVEPEALEALLDSLRADGRVA